METILGIHDGHNAAAALLKNGRVTAAVQEERLTRVKNQWGIPERAIKEVLSMQETAQPELDCVVLNGQYMTYDHLERENLIADYESSGGLRGRLKQSVKDTFVDSLYQKQRAREREMKLVALGFNNGLIEPVDHHTAHAAAAYYGSGWREPVLVLTCDGCGDRLSATVSVGKDGHLDRIASVRENDSIGRLFAMVTHCLGMVPLEHEYKVMGLAPYVGDTKEARATARLFWDMFEFDPSNKMVWRRKPGVPPMYGGYDAINNLLHRKRFDHVSAGIQFFSEEFISQWVRNCIRETNIHTVACSGGVFMNVKANKAILALPEIERLFIFPSCGDETNCIGAAYWMHAAHGGHGNGRAKAEPLGPIYWGRPIHDSAVEMALQDFKDDQDFQCEFVDNIEQVAAEAIARGKVVARAKGSMEFGARSLGNRSILARPDSPELVRLINNMIKNRDFWMPFAPSVLAERAEDYYVKPKTIDAPYMIVAFDSRPEARHKFVGAQHPYDHTVRPQEVHETWNPDYYRLLKHYEEITGEGIILNTSFNLHGFPIVYQPEDALEVLFHSGLECLALGNWWIQKK